MRTNILRVATRLVGTVMGVWMILQLAASFGPFLAMLRLDLPWWDWRAYGWSGIVLSAVLIVACGLALHLLWSRKSRVGDGHLAALLILGSLLAVSWTLWPGPVPTPVGTLRSMLPASMNLLVNPAHFALLPLWFGLAALLRFATLRRGDRHLAHRAHRPWAGPALPWLAATGMALLSLDLGLLFNGAEMDPWQWATILLTGSSLAVAIAMLARRRSRGRWPAHRWLIGGLAISGGLGIMIGLELTGRFSIWSVDGQAYVDMSSLSFSLLLPTAAVILVGAVCGHLLFRRRPLQLSS